MAEVAGLVLGTVALASLYRTCVELFESFELGRNYTYDYQLACTKVSLLRARLRSWGNLLNIEKPGDESPALRDLWAEEQDVIGGSLCGIRDIFENTSLLIERYKLTPQRSWAERYKPSLKTKSTERLHLQAPGTGHAASRAWNTLRKRTTWAIHDKTKFDGFLADLGFLVDNLEKVVERLAMPRLTKKTNKEQDGWQLREEHWAEKEEKKRMILAKERAEKAKETAVPKRGTNDQKSSTHAEQLEEVFINRMSGNIYKGSQYADDSVAVMGNIAKGPPRQHLHLGNQTGTNDACLVMGDVDPETYLALHSATVRRSMKHGLSRQTRDRESEDRADTDGNGQAATLSHKLKDLSLRDTTEPLIRKSHVADRERRHRP
jgi:hypothetical protein